MKYYAVIDTNVIVSGLLKGDSPPGEILRYTADGIIIPVLHKEIIAEYTDVLKRKKFDFTPDIISGVIEGLKKHAVYSERKETDETFSDTDDIVFYEIVLKERGSRETYLITGNIKDFPQKTYIVTPRQMLDIIGNNGQHPSETT